VIRREAERGLTDTPLIPPEAEEKLTGKAKEIGLYGIDVPEEYGGQNLGMLAKAVVIEELKYSIVPFVLPPDSPNLWMLRETCKGDHIKKYFIPYATGERKAAIAITEPAAGSDPANMQMRAEYRNGEWILNGQKTFISGARKADFIITMAVTDPKKGSRGGITAFLVDKGAKGTVGSVRIQHDGGSAQEWHAGQLGPRHVTFARWHVHCLTVDWRTERPGTAQFQHSSQRSYHGA
jgi:(R)-benzylsuccinyl-CoA dehydrogenase